MIIRERERVFFKDLMLLSRFNRMLSRRRVNTSFTSSRHKSTVAAIEDVDDQLPGSELIGLTGGGKDFVSSHPFFLFVFFFF